MQHTVIFVINDYKKNIMGTTMGKNGTHFLDALPSQGALHVVMLGLDSAGKTTALYRLKFDQYLNTVPTIGFNCEKVQGTVGRAKGVHFLVWDVGGQEKLRPLWRSYTRCTDGILFVVDSVDIERMEEAKIELMRTAKCPDNQGVPVLILANKQDLPGARDPKELEKLLSLHELAYTGPSSQSETTKCVTTGTLESSCSNNTYFSRTSENGSSFTQTLECDTKHSYSLTNNISGLKKEINNKTSEIKDSNQIQFNQTNKTQLLSSSTSPTTEMVNANSNSSLLGKNTSVLSGMSHTTYSKGWHIQPACAITGEGLQEGLEILYEMILKRRKINKTIKKKR